MKMNKVAAYTIMELIVVMILSAIVVSITYTSFKIISVQYLNYKKNIEDINDRLLLDGLLTKDINGCNYMLSRTDGIECTYKGKKIIYDWTENAIIRAENSRVDSFLLNPQEIELLFLNKREVTPGKLVNELRFNCLYKDQDQHFVYNKKYGSDLLMQNTDPEYLGKDLNNRKWE